MAGVNIAPPRVYYHQHADKAQHHRHPLPHRHPLFEQRRRQRGDQHRGKKVDCRGLGQRQVLQASGKQQAGAEQAQGTQRLQQRPTGAQHVHTRLGQKDAGHQQRMH
ncbi:hypothetical protein PPTS312_24990 [Pseudomonas putida]|uniref:Uncharacterized protein n=1 Tax=Pseudomonas putida TaxID=303 RepID=A0A7U6RCC9_PSEPU|nr:hypothetical protein PPTS312_24990 [Pseudomonas putida]